MPPIPALTWQIAYDALAASILWSLAIKRDFRRAALLRWITPLLWTRSSMLTAFATACFAASISPERIAISAFLTKERAIERYGRFRARLRSAVLIRFNAALLLANTIHPSSLSNCYPTWCTMTPDTRNTAPRGWYQVAPKSSRWERRRK